MKKIILDNCRPFNYTYVSRKRMIDELSGQVDGFNILFKSEYSHTHLVVRGVGGYELGRLSMTDFYEHDIKDEVCIVFTDSFGKYHLISKCVGGHLEVTDVEIASKIKEIYMNLANSL